jgi:molecular chaperone GrpE
MSKKGAAPTERSDAAKPSPERSPPPPSPDPGHATRDDSQPQARGEAAAAAPPAKSGDPGPAQGASEAEALRAEVAALKERLARARADYDNLQKRVARDAAAERDRAKARALEGLIPVLELAQMAANQAEAHPGPVSEGVVLLAREFRRALEREGLVPVGGVGEAFDRSRHEAVAEEAVPGVAQGCVSRVIQAGYMLDGKILRYAKVAVSPIPKDGAPPST